MAGDEHLVETTLASEQVFLGRFLDVRRDRVALPDGRTTTREYIVHPGAVMVIAVADDGRLVVERQYRHPMGRVMLEFPAGKLDDGEPPLACAKRELAEEAGYAAGAWKELGTIHPEIGYSTEFIELYEATDLTHVGQRLDEGEFLDVVAMSESELLATYDCGGFTDGKSVAALFAWRRSRGR
jgi:ADP-ribose pyrophosphatase